MLKREDVVPSHLADLLQTRGQLTAEALWLASQLEIDDFYDQLSDEEALGRLREIRSGSMDVPRLLEAT
jgi:hypothetical protein